MACGIYCVTHENVDPQVKRQLQVQVCSNGIEGIQSKNSCCALECGQCGGAGCSTVLGLGANVCCESAVQTSGVLCDETNKAPCIIDPGTWGCVLTLSVDTPDFLMGRTIMCRRIK